MILPARAPLEPPDRPLRALYLSLNGPVVTLESFPSGPARAAVAVHEEGATLCVRSVRTSQLRFFTTTRALAGDRRVAADAALSFAESMGFLFDDDEVAARGDGGVRVATARWQELLGETPPLPDEAQQDAPGVGPPLDTLQLEAAAPEAASDSGVEAGPEILLETPWEEPAPAPVLLLSKFRRQPARGAGPAPRGDGELSDPRLRLMSRF